MNIKNLPEEKIIKYIKKIIKKSYEFIGYIEFANQINNLVENKAKNLEKLKKSFQIDLLLLMKFIILEHKIIALEILIMLKVGEQSKIS